MIVVINNDEYILSATGEDGYFRTAVCIMDEEADAAMAYMKDDNERYQRMAQGKEQIIHKLRKQGFRVTKQRELILDIIFEHDCTSCKEIYYQAIQEDPGIGMATVYRMVNTLTDIGVLKVASLKPQTLQGPGSGCEIVLKNNHKVVLTQAEWLDMLRRAMLSKGYGTGEEIMQVIIQ